MSTYFKDLKAGLEEAVAYEKGLLDLHSELVEVPELSAESRPKDLLVAQKLAYGPSGLICIAFEQEAESKEYGACSFKLSGKSIRFRVAKITPTKIGQFVTFWKRIGSGPIMPFDAADSFDFLVVSVRAADRIGQFIFPKSVLRQKGFVSFEGKGGKRAMRVYPPWDIADNPQAKKTQGWQLIYFVEIQPNFSIDRIQNLFSL